jgi:hypothetical protein
LKIVGVIVLAAGFSLVAAPKSKAEPPFAPALASQTRPPIRPVVVFGVDSRETVEAYARDHRLDPARERRLHAASGLIRCGNARGAGQLTLTDDVVTTAAHVFFNESGGLRADSAHCQFIVEADGEEITTAIDVGSIVAGSTNPYNENAVHDWAVARLRRPLREATPYPLGAPEGGAPILFVARGHSDWGGARAMSEENCRMRDTLDTGAEGTREFSFDCAAGVGASGGGLMNETGSRLLAIFVGYRSIAPEKHLAFSPRNYNFAVTIEGAFRRAILDTAALERAAAR